MYLYLLIAFSFSTSVNTTPEKQYIKTYYENGNLKYEGWSKDNVKSGYWKFYYENSQLASKGNYKNNEKSGYWYFYDENENLEKEGHFVDGTAQNWWIFYEIGSPYKVKIQLVNNKKNGYALCYKNNKLIRAEKYKNNLKIDEWTSVLAFKLDNPNASL